MIVNHAWRALKEKLGWQKDSFWWGVVLSRSLTFMAVVVAWVFFKAETVDGAVHVLQTMFGMKGLILPSGFQPYVQSWLAGVDVHFIQERVLQKNAAIYLFVLFVIVMFAPNVQQMMIRYAPCYEAEKHVKPYRFSFVEWRPSALFALVVFLLFCIAQYQMDGPSEFLYFDF